jgi:general secretion pathway protein B
MSHILDALQKVQEEKTAKLKQSAITGGVLLSSPSVHTKTRKRFYLLASTVAVLLCVVGFVIWMALQPPQKTFRDYASKPSVQPLQAVPTPPVADVPPSVQTVVPTPPVQKQAAVQPTVAVAVESLQRKSVPKSKSTPQIDSDRHPKALPTITAQTGISPPARATEPEGIKLTGIAWQDDRKNRRAVVNDLLVGEGTVIAGVKVLEIKPTLVRFEKMGIVYETTLPR